MCVIVEPGARTATVASEAPAKTPLALYLLSSDDRYIATGRGLQQQMLLQQQVPGAVEAAGRFLGAAVAAAAVAASSAVAAGGGGGPLVETEAIGPGR